MSASLLTWAILGEALGWEVALGGAAVVAGGTLVVLYEGMAAPASRRRLPCRTSAPCSVNGRRPRFRMDE